MDIVNFDLRKVDFMTPDRVGLHSWEWERGKASHPVYLERARIFRRLRFSLRIHFLRHFALMIKLREGLLVSLRMTKVAIFVVKD